MTIGPYGRVTLHQARVAAQRVFAAKLEGRDPAAEKRTHASYDDSRLSLDAVVIAGGLIMLYGAFTG